MLAKKGVVAFTQLQRYQIVCYHFNATNNIFECNGRHFSFIVDSKNVVQCEDIDKINSFITHLNSYRLTYLPYHITAYCN